MHERLAILNRPCLTRVGRLVVVLRRFSLALAFICLAAASAACNGASGASRTPTPIPPTATPTPPDLTVFRNFIYPIKGACLPSSDDLMPNAPREYRGGIHEGVDFYDYRQLHRRS